MHLCMTTCPGIKTLGDGSCSKHSGQKSMSLFPPCTFFKVFFCVTFDSTICLVISLNRPEFQKQYCLLICIASLKAPGR